MIIIGIDPGLATTGIGLIHCAKDGNCHAQDWMVIQTQPPAKTSERLQEIAHDLEQLLIKSKPDLAVIERLFFTVNKKTAIDVLQARGVMLFMLQQKKIPILEPTPLQLKGAITGDGKADKKQMQDMVQRILKLKELPQPDDASDALALALYGSYHRKTTESTLHFSANDRTNSTVFNRPQTSG